MSTGSAEDDENLDLKTKRAWTDKRESFSPSEIDDPIKLVRMRASTGLWDDDFNELSICTRSQETAERKARRAHFKFKSGQPRTVLNRDSADPTHNLTVDDICNRLSAESSSVVLKGKAWDHKGSRADVTLWKQHAISDYRWHKEPATRLIMESGQHLQPDIIGIDITRINRTAGNPGVVIEVVHHHWPDQMTWQHLRRLSELNYIVAFYFVTSDLGRNNYASKFSRAKSPNEILVSHYLTNGVFFIDGKAVGGNPDANIDYQECKQRAIEMAEKSFTAEREIRKKRPKA